MVLVEERREHGEEARIRRFKRLVFGNRPQLFRRSIPTAPRTVPTRVFRVLLQLINVFFCLSPKCLRSQARTCTAPRTPPDSLKSSAERCRRRPVCWNDRGTIVEAAVIILENDTTINMRTQAVNRGGLLVSRRLVDLLIFTTQSRKLTTQSKRLFRKKLSKRRKLSNFSSEEIFYVSPLSRKLETLPASKRRAA